MGEKALANPRNINVRSRMLSESMTRTAAALPPGTCPLETQLAVLRDARSQTCGKCTPCRAGLAQLEAMLELLAHGTPSAYLHASEEGATQQGAPVSLETMRHLAATIAASADCAIGVTAAQTVLEGMETFKEEYAAHATTGICSCSKGQEIPCVSQCPAHVNVPGYISLVGAGAYDQAISLIRQDNPFPTACALICEYPCEERCRRQLLDAPLNIRGLKKFAVDQVAADTVALPAAHPATGKTVAVIGGGPAGLTAAYFLALMGHAVNVYERQEKLGGMLRYGIPNYRFPKNRLDEDIRAILAAGNIAVHTGVSLETPESIAEVSAAHDALFVAIGAQHGKTLRLENAQAQGVTSAVAMLDEVGNGCIPDYADKRVVVVGGGNVAMDAARTAVRCGAESVSVVYRRRKEDMTALDAEIEAALAEGVEFVMLAAPKAVAVDAAGTCSGLVVQPQMIGAYGSGGRPAPRDAAQPEETIPCDVLLIAVGQAVVSDPFEAYGMPVQRGAFAAELDTSIPAMPGVFAGGDCATGPATAIRAIAAGKVAAYAIDAYLGFSHEIACGVEIPAAQPLSYERVGRAHIAERPVRERLRDFDHVEKGFTHEEAVQEAHRCLRCDHYGFGCVNGGALS